MSSSMLHLFVTLCAIHCAFADSYMDPKNVHFPEIVRGPEVTKLPAALGDQPVSPTKKDAGIKLPNCSYLGRYAMRDNLRRRLAKGINLRKRNMVYDCELEGFATIPTAESFSGNSHTGMFDGTMMFFQAEKKSCYKPSHFIRDALRTWSNILQNVRSRCFRKDRNTTLQWKKYISTFSLSKSCIIWKTWICKGSYAELEISSLFPTDCKIHKTEKFFSPTETEYLNPEHIVEDAAAEKSAVKMSPKKRLGCNYASTSYQYHVACYFD